jgi:hypothetical protein
MAFTKGAIIVDKIYLDHSIYPIEDYHNLIDFCPATEKEIPNELPMSTQTKFRMTVYINIDHARNLVTRSSITGKRTLYC